VAPATFNATPTVPRCLALVASSRNVAVSTLEASWGIVPLTLANQSDCFVVSLSGATGAFGGNSWNGNNCCCWDSGVSPAPDDSAYIADPTNGLIARIRAAGWPVATASNGTPEVFGVGDSAGEGILMRAACEHADQFAGVFGMAGAPGQTTGAASPADVACTPSQPLAFAHAHGTADISAEPYTGSVSPNSGMTNRCNSTIDTGDTIDQLLVADGCSSQASMTVTTGFGDFDPAVAGSETDRLVATGCIAGGSVEHWRMNGTPHNPSPNTTNWPAAIVAWMAAHHRP
jgi:poly(3-hydroxybutyrate) depolymerase